MIDDDAPPSWSAWWLSSGTLAEHEAGAATWTRHEREAQIAAPTSKTTSGATLVYPTLHLGKGTRWIKPKTDEKPTTAPKQPTFW